MNDILDMPLFDHEGLIHDYRMDMALGNLGGRDAFKADEGALIDKFGLNPASRTAVTDRDWKEIIRLGRNLFLILKISTVDPDPINSIGLDDCSGDCQ